jgi:hypothetical protein
MAWEVADIEATVAGLRARGVVFQEYDLPGLKTANGIADIDENYPSKSVGERGAWFRDSEGNLARPRPAGPAIRCSVNDFPSGPAVFRNQGCGHSPSRFHATRRGNKGLTLQRM